MTNTRPPAISAFHRERTKLILQDHPEIRALIGHYPGTALYIAILAALQLALAFVASTQSWWVAMTLALTAGVIPSLGLYFLIHECGHYLVFKNRSLNSITGIFANAINVIPYAVSYQAFHHKHHVHFGSQDNDPDMAKPWESRLVGNSPIRKLLWLLLFPVIQSFRGLRNPAARVSVFWLLLNVAIVLLFDVFVLWLLGPKALAYLLVAAFFSMGLPLGAFWIPEHYIADSNQDTCSYYGWLNRVFFNRGYHNEHHDFPSVPWNRLPRVREMAREWYDPLVSHPTYLSALTRFVFDRRLTLSSHVRH
jgi:sphingolipid delta-4 desaturase